MKTKSSRVFDYSKIRARIVELGITQEAFAAEMGLSNKSVGLKLNNKVPWTQYDIDKALEVLGLSVADIPTYFFAVKVQ